MIETRTYKERKAMGDTAEDYTQRVLASNKIPSKLVGVETWLSRWLVNAICIPNVPGYEVMRHFPDLDTGRALIQVKSALNSEWYPTVPLEIDSYKVCMKLARDGVPVLMLWLLPGNKLMGEWVQNLKTKQANSEPGRRNTPFILIYKNQLKPLRDFIFELKAGY